MNVNGVEAIWLAINLFSAGVLFANTIAAWHDWRANKGAGRANEIQAWANVRTELILLYVVLVLIVISLPALTKPGETPLTLPLALFISLALAIAILSVLARRTRLTIRRLLWDDDKDVVP